MLSSVLLHCTEILRSEEKLWKTENTAPSVGCYLTRLTRLVGYPTEWFSYDSSILRITQRVGIENQVADIFSKLPIHCEDCNYISNWKTIITHMRSDKWGFSTPSGNPLACSLGKSKSYRWEWDVSSVRFRQNPTKHTYSNHGSCWNALLTIHSTENTYNKMLRQVTLAVLINVVLSRHNVPRWQTLHTTPLLLIVLKDTRSMEF